MCTLGPKLRLHSVLPADGLHSTLFPVKYDIPMCSLDLTSTKCLKLTNCLSFLFHFKDVIPKELQSHIVYKFLCGNCNVTYYDNS